MERKTILCCDDDVKILGLLDRVLSTRGYQVIKARDGREAVDKINSVNPDMIIMDIMMPGLDGAEIVKIIKRTQNLENIPVMFLSGIAAREEPGKSVSSVKVGEDYFKAMSKPFVVEELLKEVESAIG